MSCAPLKINMELMEGGLEKVLFEEMISYNVGK